MSLATIEHDIRTALGDAGDHVRAVLDQHLPRFLAEAAAIQASPLAQAIETAALGPADETIIAEFISKWAARYPVPAAPEPVNIIGRWADAPEPVNSALTMPDQHEAAPDQTAGIPEPAAASGPVIGGQAS